LGRVEGKESWIPDTEEGQKDLLSREGHMRKKIIRIAMVIALIGVMGFVFTSCASKEKVAAQKAGLPEWYLNPPVAEDALYGVGSAKMSTLDMSRTMAVSRARDDVARQLEVLVKSAILDYAQEAGRSGEAQVIQFAETISVQITNTTLKGVRTEKVEQGKDETLYALVVCSLDLLQEEASEEFKRTEEAMYSEFKAREAEKWLEKQIEGSKK
jgi:uncharacterized membrane protein